MKLEQRIQTYTVRVEQTWARPMFVQETGSSALDASKKVLRYFGGLGSHVVDAVLTEEDAQLAAESADFVSNRYEVTVTTGPRSPDGPAIVVMVGCSAYGVRSAVRQLLNGTPTQVIGVKRQHDNYVYDSCVKKAPPFGSICAANGYEESNTVLWECLNQVDPATAAHYQARWMGALASEDMAVILVEELQSLCAPYTRLIQTKAQLYKVVVDEQELDAAIVAKEVIRDETAELVPGTYCLRYDSFEDQITLLVAASTTRYRPVWKHKAAGLRIRYN